MNRILRLLTTVMIGLGFILLAGYLQQSKAMEFAALDEPSYYVLQDYRYVLIFAGITLAVAVLACFLAWFRSMDTASRALPNAAGADQKDIQTWVSGTSLDTQTEEGTVSDQAPSVQAVADRAEEPSPADQSTTLLLQERNHQSDVQQPDSSTDGVSERATVILEHQDHQGGSSR